jgi:hypothetical protein
LYLHRKKFGYFFLGFRYWVLGLDYSRNIRTSNLLPAGRQGAGGGVTSPPS